MAVGPRRDSVPSRAGYNSQTTSRLGHLPARLLTAVHAGRGALSEESAQTDSSRSPPEPVRVPKQQAPLDRLAEFSGPTLRIHPFTSKRFHVLLNSLFKVLFNFPSRYLSAIGLVSVFSLRWSLPPTLGCIHKQPDSRERPKPRRRSPVKA